MGLAYFNYRNYPDQNRSLKKTKAPRGSLRTQHQRNLSSLHWAGYVGRTFT